MRIILTTGGTGGHIFPALAVAEELQEHELLFIGSWYGPEAKLVPDAGLKFVGLPVRGILGRGFKSVGAALGLCKATLQARQILAEFKPQVVAGFGAYASFPALMAAKLGKVPVVIHEQNSVPGMVNKLMARGAKAVCLSLPLLGSSIKGNTVITGNPVRQSISNLPAPTNFSGKRLLVLGGSLGAKSLNSIILANLKKLLAANISIVHQTGTADYERVVAGYTAHNLPTNQVVAFIDDMASAYAQADMVLSRAGASAVAELAIAAKPSLLIPFPFATHDHQTANAQVLVQAGAARMLMEHDLGHLNPGQILIDLLHDPENLQLMSEAAQTLAKPEAANRVATIIVKSALGR